MLSVIETGRALRTIRDAGLYREAPGTVKNYCAERWDWVPRSNGGGPRST